MGSENVQIALRTLWTAPNKTTEYILDPYLSSPTTGTTSFINEDKLQQNSKREEKEIENEPKYSVIKRSKEKARPKVGSVDEIDSTINVERNVERRPKRPIEIEQKISTISYPLQRHGK